jgi:hypothetical protein
MAKSVYKCAHWVHTAGQRVAKQFSEINAPTRSDSPFRIQYFTQNESYWSDIVDVMDAQTEEQARKAILYHTSPEDQEKLMELWDCTQQQRDGFLWATRRLENQLQIYAVAMRGAQERMTVAFALTTQRIAAVRISDPAAARKLTLKLSIITRALREQTERTENVLHVLVLVRFFAPRVSVYIHGCDHTWVNIINVVRQWQK